MIIGAIDNKTASKNFKNSLAIGHNSEDAVCKKINKKYPKAHVMEGYCKGYDIYVPEINKKVEVKQDKKSNFTGNIVVEIEFGGKPSALSTTEADYWVFDDGEIYIWTTPDILRQIIKPMIPVRFVGNGDNKSKLAYLVKKDIIIKNALMVDRYITI
jgi:soluble cytochrome b562